MSVLQILISILTAVYLALVYFWTLGALFFDAGKSSPLGWLLACVWTLVFAAILLFLEPYWVAVLVVTAMLFFVATWWLTQRPSHERNWDANFAELPSIEVDGDHLTVHNVRNTQYRSLRDFDCRFETREYSLNDLKAVDLIILYWGSRLMCHPMVVFDFGNHRHLCFSIEVRYRANEEYAFFRNLFRQNELMYVVCDERDAILRRTKHAQGQDCYLYRFQLDQDHCHDLLQDYIQETNCIHENPRWYNALAANCTTSIYRRRRDKVAWDWRILLNGSLDKMFYDWGRLYQGMPFEELKKVSWVNERANAASEKNFSAEIRSGLPGFDYRTPQQ